MSKARTVVDPRDEIARQATSILDKRHSLTDSQAAALRNLLAEIVSTLNESKSSG